MFDAVQNVSKADVFGIDNGRAPDMDADGRRYPKALRVPVTLQAAITAEIDVLAIIEGGAIDNIQTAWIDNYDGANYVEIFIPASQQRLRVAPSSGAYLPILFPQAKLQLTRADAGNCFVTFINVPLPAISMVQGSGGVAAAVSISGPLGDGVPATGVRVTQTTRARTPALSTVAGAGSVAAGAQKVTLANIGGANATVLGDALQAGNSITFEANGNDTLGAIAYDATGTSLQISTLT